MALRLVDKDIPGKAYGDARFVGGNRKNFLHTRSGIPPSTIASSRENLASTLRINESTCYLSTELPSNRAWRGRLIRRAVWVE